MKSKRTDSEYDIRKRNDKINKPKKGEIKLLESGILLAMYTAVIGFLVYMRTSMDFYEFWTNEPVYWIYLCGVLSALIFGTFLFICIWEHLAKSISKNV